MNRGLRATFDALIRLMVVLGLVCSPMAHALAMAAMTAPQTASASAGCPHHAKSAQASPEPAKPGDCCVKKGSACHCAMAVALPTAALPAALSTPSEHPVSVPRLIASILPTPEPPPPRG